MHRSIALVIVILVFAGSGPGAAAGETSLSIIPPGQNTTLKLFETIDFLINGTLPPHVEDQRIIYARLGQAPPVMVDSDLAELFKPAPLGPPADPSSRIKPRLGVVITRDDFGVPHVWGLRRADVMFGIGYATAQDRLLFMDMARRAARSRLSEFVGPFENIEPSILQFALELDAQSYSFSSYTEEDLQAQFDALPTRFPIAGRRVQRDFEAYVEGVNAYIADLQKKPLSWPVEYWLLGRMEPWTITDAVALAISIEGLFGGGGGSEHRNAELFQALAAELGAERGAALYRDLREAQNPETPTTASADFPYLIPEWIDPMAVALPDLGSFVPHPPLVYEPAPAVLQAQSARSASPSAFSGLGALARLRRGPSSRSNFLAVTAMHAAGGRPIAVMGPQTGYFAPQVLMEISYQGGGLNARGVLPPGFPYVILGRGRSHAWSPTSGGSDATDARVELLCEPDGSLPAADAKAYFFDGECIPMVERIEQWCAGKCPEGESNVSAVVQRTRHGLVFGRASVDGRPVALVRQRASFGVELDAAVTYMLTSSLHMNATRFENAMALNPASFNWAYIDDVDVAYFHSGRYPRRAEGVHPDFPSWGTGAYEWEGFLTKAEHPRERNPASGYLASWNNKPAPAWRAADDVYSFGSVQRVLSLNTRLDAALASGMPLSVAQMVEIMADAGHVDLRGSQILPWALELIYSAGSTDAALAPALDILVAWEAAGAMRRDRDGDGEYEYSGAVALMDAWYRRMIQAALGHQLGGFFDLIPMGFDDKPGAIGSAYQSGYYGYLQKTLRMALGMPVDAPFEELRCADGSADGCAAALLDSLAGAVADMTDRFGSPDPADWRVDPEAEQIEFQPTGLLTVGPMPWINRPGFQQVIQFDTAP